jgi:hypothetical protein
MLRLSRIGQKYTLEKNPNFGSFIDDVNDLRKSFHTARDTLLQEQQKAGPSASTTPSTAPLAATVSSIASKIQLPKKPSQTDTASKPAASSAGASWSSTEPSPSAVDTSATIKDSPMEPDEIMVLPVEWRAKLKFDHPGEAAEDTNVQDVTLDGVPTIRAIISHILLDGMQMFCVHFKMTSIL